MLTPLEQGSLIATPSADARSIMCYQLPGAITKDGQPILGGTDIDQWDREFIALIYPKLKPRPKATQGEAGKKKAARKSAAKKTVAKRKLSAKAKTARLRRRAPAKRTRAMRRRR